MNRICGIAACALALALCACHRSGPLTSGASLGGFSDIDQPESYTRATLYTYMDGGADFYVNQGFSRLYVRHYAQGNDRFIEELFEMKDAPAASRIYLSTRRPHEEKELAGGCLASITPTEIQVAKGRYYLDGRNEDPLATRNDALIELTRNVLMALPGQCALTAKQ